MILELPIPPSANHRLGHSRFGTYRKPEYKRWLQEAEVAAIKQKVQRCPGPVAVTIAIYPGKGWNIRRDIDNAEKCTLDFLQTCGGGGLIDGDDCRVLQRLLTIIRPVRESAGITVRIKPIKNPVIIQTKAESKRAASAVSRGRAKTKKVKALEASTTQPVENEPRDSFFYSLDELREIAREAKSRGKAMARKLSEECDSCR